MSHVFDGFAGGLNVSVAPEGFELGAALTGAVDERLYFRRGTGARDIRSECSHCESCNTVPLVVMCGPHAWIEEEIAQDIALVRRY